MDSPIDFNTHRQRLLAEKEEVAKRLLSHDGAFRASIKSEPCDAFDVAQEQNDIRIEDRIAEIEDRHLEAIDKALHRLMAGVYGKCESCNKPIDRARLNAVPDATLCVECQEAREGSPRLRILPA